MAKFNLNIKWLFVLTMIILFTGITLTNYFFSLHLAEKNLNHHTETVALLFKSETERLINPVENFLYNVQALVCCKILNFNDIVKTNKFFMDFIKKISLCNFNKLWGW